MTSNKKYLDIVKHYEECLEKHGDSHLGVDWPKAEDVDKRYQVMLELILIHEKEFDNRSLLDLGCGAAHLLGYINKKKIENISYSGLDISPKFVALSQEKFPTQTFYHLDVLESSAMLPSFDYIVINGAFTEKREMSFDEMFDYLKSMLRIVYSKSNKGIAFNLMTKHVDWERDDLFHVPFDTIAAFISKELSRNFVIRNDYGLYEYTVYVYKQPTING